MTLSWPTHFTNQCSVVPSPVKSLRRCLAWGASCSKWNHSSAGLKSAEPASPRGFEHELCRPGVEAQSCCLLAVCSGARCCTFESLSFISCRIGIVIVFPVGF